MRRSLLLVFATACVLAHGAQPAARDPDAAPAVNWVLPMFSKEGFRTMTLRGAEARPVAGNRLNVTDLNITVFSGDVTAHVDNVFLSPSALFDPKEKRASGEKGVRLISDDVEATGTRWTYDHTQKHVTLADDVRIVLNIEIKDLLK